MCGHLLFWKRDPSISAQIVSNINLFQVNKLSTPIQTVDQTW